MILELLGGKPGTKYGFFEVLQTPPSWLVSSGDKINFVG